jgi:hypothetical protein
LQGIRCRLELGRARVDTAARIDKDIEASALCARIREVGHAWSAYRQGRAYASSFGVYGTDSWGAGEIRGNLVKDLAALNKVEMLPWDVWGRMKEAYQDEAGADYDELLDEVSAACAADDPAALSHLYAREELCVPSDLVH